MPNSDEDFRDTTFLVYAAKAGDRLALDDLFRRYLPIVRQIVAVRMGMRLRQLTESDDLVQDALLRVFHGIERFDQRSEGGFRHWLARCVERELIDAARRLGAKKRGADKLRSLSGDDGSNLTLLDIPRQTGPSPSQIFYGKELEERIESALLRMRPGDRELIVLRQLCAMSFEEIATTLGAKEGAVRKSFARALKRLEELMED